MGLIFRLVELLLVIVPLAGAIYAAVKGISAIRRQNEPVAEPPVTVQDSTKSQAVQWRTITRVIDEHNRTDARWLEYELDAAKLLDFPAMTDMRDPLTVAFHRAKLRAELVRPGKAEDLLDDVEAARQYLDAVEAYVTAFEAAENEAKRRRRADFSRQDQQRLTRAQSLLRVAADRGATPQERERAYDLARGELDGLLVLPDRTTAALERGIAGELDD
ncbi:hypothetical protein [Mycolicibacterium aichiense]|uniref:Uncharacterized protein n=1 Tax=Mycolicibacterium aichiense TaxID=1799 RepID=A0AAD1HL81_9MYCO|nr:hypothetical protein [Mycolicibacterium aichiense]MCV7019862.1 hypothetical protein [Mycolicibacterium aichiense]BBX07452.1 hypothetical protein MAIC_22550 [Mycolicibacterium aichiense]STZ81267.1 Uncharacterised protein [Mycolicibacterium aichiense]